MGGLGRWEMLGNRLIHLMLIIHRLSRTFHDTYSDMVVSEDEYLITTPTHLARIQHYRLCVVEMGKYGALERVVASRGFCEGPSHRQERCCQRYRVPSVSPVAFDLRRVSPKMPHVGERGPDQERSRKVCFASDGKPQTWRL